MDKSRMSKLSEISMSGYLVGQSTFKKSMVKLKPSLKCAQYFHFAKDLNSPSTEKNEIFITSEFVSGKIVLVHDLQKKALVKDLASHVRPLGLAIIDHGNVLAVVDEGADGRSFLKYYRRNESGTLTLEECLTKLSSGDLSSCTLEGDRFRCPENVCRDWKPKDIVEVKSGNVTICDASDGCENRLTTYTPEGRRVVSFGRAVGPGNSSFVNPLHMAVDPLGRIFSSDWENRNVQVFDSRGLWLSSIGRGSKYCNEGRLDRPSGLSCDGIGNLFVCDVSTSRLVMYSSSGEFIENIISRSRGSPTAVKVNAQRQVIAVSYMDHSGNFKKFSLSGLPMSI